MASNDTPWIEDWDEISKYTAWDASQLDQEDEFIQSSSKLEEVIPMKQPRDFIQHPSPMNRVKEEYAPYPYNTESGDYYEEETIEEPFAEASFRLNTKERLMDDSYVYNTTNTNQKITRKMKRNRNFKNSPYKKKVDGPMPMLNGRFTYDGLTDLVIETFKDIPVSDLEEYQNTANISGCCNTIAKQKLLQLVRTVLQAPNDNAVLVPISIGEEKMSNMVGLLLPKNITRPIMRNLVSYFGQNYIVGRNRLMIRGEPLFDVLSKYLVTVATPTNMVTCGYKTCLLSATYVWNDKIINVAHKDAGMPREKYPIITSLTALVLQYTNGGVKIDNFATMKIGTNPAVVAVGDFVRLITDKRLGVIIINEPVNVVAAMTSNNMPFSGLLSNTRASMYIVPVQTRPNSSETIPRRMSCPMKKFHSTKVFCGSCKVIALALTVLQTPEWFANENWIWVPQIIEAQHKTGYSLYATGSQNYIVLKNGLRKKIPEPKLVVAKKDEEMDLPEGLDSLDDLFGRLNVDEVDYEPEEEDDETDPLSGVRGKVNFDKPLLTDSSLATPVSRNIVCNVIAPTTTPVTCHDFMHADYMPECLFPWGTVDAIQICYNQVQHLQMMKPGESVISTTLQELQAKALEEPKKEARYSGYRGARNYEQGYRH